MKTALRLLFVAGVLLSGARAFAQTALVQTTLSADVAELQEEIYLTSVAGVSVGDFGYVDRELFTITNVNTATNTARVRRGTAGKLTPHTAGVTVYLGSPSKGFVSYDPAGRCDTRTTPTVPVINVVTGGTFECTAATWTQTNGGGGSVVGELSDLTDVDVTGAVDKDGLFYDSATSKWVKRTIAGGLTGCLDYSTPWTPDLDLDCVVTVADAQAITGTKSFTPSSTQSITATTDVVLANANVVQVSPTSDLTLSPTPTTTIADGQPGQPLQVCNVNATYTLTLQDETRLAGSNIRNDGVNLIIRPDTCRNLAFINGDWRVIQAERMQVAPYRVFTIRNDSWLGTGVTTAGANRIRGQYFTVDQDAKFSKLAAAMGSTAGGASTEWAFGLYDTAGARLCQSGALSAASVNVTTFADCALTLKKGVYIIAWGGENTTMRFVGLATGTFVGAIGASANGPLLTVDFPVGDVFSDTTGLPATLTVGSSTRLGDVSVLGAVLY